MWDGVGMLCNVQAHRAGQAWGYALGYLKQSPAIKHAGGSKNLSEMVPVSYNLVSLFSL